MLLLGRQGYKKKCFHLKLNKRAIERTHPRKKVREGGRERETEKSSKTNEANSRKWPKNPIPGLVGALCGLAGPDFGPANLFSGKFVRLVARHHGHLSR